MDKYMSSNEHLKKIKDDIPVRLLRKNRKAPDDLYLVDSVVAANIAASLKPYILSGNKTILETNPGFGFITRELLDYGKLDCEYPGCLTIFNRDFFSIWKLSYQDRHDNGDRVKRLLSGIENRDWSQEPTLAIIGTLATSNFIRHLILSLIFQFGVMTFGRCELYLVLPPPLYIQLTAGPDTGLLLYRASSVLFQIFCDYQILNKVPRKAFLPWDNTREFKANATLNKFNGIDPDSMYLTRIVFKENLPVPADRLQHIWYFVRHMMLSRRHRVIPNLEKWIPGCGTKLILANSSSNLKKNVNIYPDLDIFTQTGQLTASQILNMYNDFSSYPEYSESSFIASMETALLKMDAMNDIDEPSNDEDRNDSWPDDKKSEEPKDVQNSNEER
ncbi:mitochondrial transcription factor B2 [Carabus blaptoides fortunei]